MDTRTEESRVSYRIFWCVGEVCGALPQRLHEFDYSSFPRGGGGGGEIEAGGAIPGPPPSV